MSALGNLSGDVRNWGIDRGMGEFVVTSDGMWSGGSTRGHRFVVEISREAFDGLQFECPKPSIVWDEQFGPVKVAA